MFFLSFLAERNKQVLALLVFLPVQHAVFQMQHLIFLCNTGSKNATRTEKCNTSIRQKNRALSSDDWG